MIEALLGLPANLLHRLVTELDLEALPPPYTAARLAARLDADEETVAAAAAGLHLLHARGGSQRASAALLGAAARREASRPAPVAVWSGIDLPGSHVRSTRAVYRELFATAERSAWVSTYVVHDGEDVLGPLADRMAAVADLDVTLLVNVERKPGDPTLPAVVVAAFATRFWSRKWPGERRPRAFYDPRALALDDPGAGVLHAKVTVIDDRRVFVTSANLTPRALDHNVEAGLLVSDPDLARAMVARFQALITRGMVVPLPTT